MASYVKPCDDDVLGAWRAAAWRVAEAREVWRAAADGSGSARDHAHDRYAMALAEEELAADHLELVTGKP